MTQDREKNKAKEVPRGEIYPIPDGRRNTYPAKTTNRKWEAHPSASVHLSDQGTSKRGESTGWRE